MSDVADLPLIDEYLAGELYGPSGDPEVDAMQQELWQSIRDDVVRDLGEAENAAAHEIKAVLHRIAGYVSTSGFKRLGVHLKTWEHEPDPAGVAPARGASARAWAVETIEAMEARFPHLRNS